MTSVREICETDQARKESVKKEILRILELSESRSDELIYFEEESFYVWEMQKIHEYLDHLLLEYIADNDITSAFNNIPKWYS